MRPCCRGPRSLHRAPTASAPDRQPAGPDREPLERFTAGQRSQVTSTVNMASEQPATVEPQRRAADPAASAGRDRRADRRATQASATTPAKAILAADPSWGRSTVVARARVCLPSPEGLWSGEGNRYVNIIASTRRTRTFSSPSHEVVAGQKLIIPPLPKPTVIRTSLPTSVQELFDKVETIGKRPASQPSTRPQPGGRQRGPLVHRQDGDNLWKIAFTSSGRARYDEIARLNTGLLQDGEKIKVA